MSESTPQGDSIVVTDVDTAAEALMNRYSQAETVDDAPKEEAEAEVVETEVEETLEAEPEGEEESEESEAIDAKEEAEEARFSNLSELAEAAGMDIEDFKKSISVHTKVQGEEKDVNLADLIKGYQLESDYTRKNEAFISEQKQWEEQRTEAQAKLQTDLEKTGRYFQLAQQQLTHEFNAINWRELESNDSSQYLLQRQKFGERQAQIDQAINQATQHAEQVILKQKQEGEAKQDSYLQQQDELLLKAIPEWKEPTVKREQAAKVAEFLASTGYTPEEIANIRDHRVILMARKAMTGDKVASSVDIAKKKVKKVPKLIKPNARQPVNQNTAQISKRRAQLKKSGSVDDLAKLLIARS